MMTNEQRMIHSATMLSWSGTGLVGTNEISTRPTKPRTPRPPVRLPVTPTRRIPPVRRPRLPVRKRQDSLHSPHLREAQRQLVPLTLRRQRHQLPRLRVRPHRRQRHRAGRPGLPSHVAAGLLLTLQRRPRLQLQPPVQRPPFLKLIRGRLVIQLHNGSWTKCTRFRGRDS